MFNQALRRLFALLIVVSVSGVLPLSVNMDIASAAPPNNDNIADATDLTSVTSPLTLTTNNAEATLETGEDQLVSTDDYYYWSNFTNSLWYKITPAAGVIEFTTADQNNGADTILAVFTFVQPASFGSPTLIGLNDDIIQPNQIMYRKSTIGFNADGTSTYYIAVGSFGTSIGDITLSWRYPVVATNNDIANAIQLNPEGETRTNHNNYFSDATTAEINFFVTSQTTQSWDNSVWFKVQPAAGSWGVRLGNFVGTRIVVLSNNDFSPQSFVSLSDNRIGFDADGSTMYYIGIGGVDVEQSFDIIFSSIVKPDRPTSAQFNVGANTSVTWTPAANFDPTLHTFSTSITNGNHTRYCSATPLTSCTFPRLHNGTWTLSIAAYETLHGFFNNAYEVTFDVTDISNDYFGAATSLSGDSGELNDFFDGATVETGEPTHFSSNTYSTLWYSYTPTVSGTSTFNVTTTDVDRSGELQPIVAVYSGTALANLQSVATSGNSVTWPSVAGQRYFVAVASQLDNPYPENTPYLYHSMTWSHVPTPAPPAAVETPTTTPVVTPKITSVKVKNRATMASILKKAKIKTPKNSKVTYKIAKSSKKLCSISSSRIRFTKKGTCSMTVRVKPKKGATKSYQLAVRN